MRKIDTIKLKGLDYGLDLIKDDRYRIYRNEERDVTIYAIACINETIDYVFNATVPEAFAQIIEFMNNHNHLIIKWTKEEGTTSDYTIYCNTNYKGPWNIIDIENYLFEQRIYMDEDGEYDFEPEPTRYKYNIVENGRARRF